MLIHFEQLSGGKTLQMAKQQIQKDVPKIIYYGRLKKFIPVSDISVEDEGKTVLEIICKQFDEQLNQVLYVISVNTQSKHYICTQ